MNNRNNNDDDENDDDNNNNIDKNNGTSTKENRDRLILKIDDTTTTSSSSTSIITCETSSSTTMTPTSSCTPSPIQQLVLLSDMDSNNNNSSNPDEFIVKSSATIEKETLYIEDTNLVTSTMMNDSTFINAINNDNNSHNHNNNNVLLDNVVIKPSTTIDVTSSTTVDTNDDKKNNSNQSINESDNMRYTIDKKVGAATDMNNSNALVTISMPSNPSRTTDISILESNQNESIENNDSTSIDNIITTSSTTTISTINSSTNFPTDDNTLPVATPTTNTLNQSRSSTRSQQQQEVQEEINRPQQQQQRQRRHRRNRIRIDDSIIEQQYQQQEYNREYIKQLQTHVTKEAEKMLDKLIEHLQKKPSNKYKNTTITTTTSSIDTTTTTPIVGVTLPASAIGWISSYVFPDDYNENTLTTTTTTTTTPTKTIPIPTSGVEDTTTSTPTTTRSQTQTQHQQQQIQNSRLRTLSRSMRSRLRLLMILLPRLTHLRVVWKLDDSEEEWPQPMKGKDGIDFDFITEMESSMNNDSIDTNIDDELLSLYSYFIEYRKWKFSPRIDLRLFTNSLHVLLLDQIPGRFIHYWNSIQSSLQVLRVERTCIYNHYQPKRRLNNNSKIPGIANTSETNVPIREERKGGRPLSTPTSWTLFQCYFLESNNIIDYDSVQKQQLDQKRRLDQQQQQSEDIPSNNNTIYDDPLAPQMPESINCSTNYTATHLNLEFSALTHVRFSNCCLGEPTGNVRCVLIEITSPKLQSICLSQNQIVTERTALQGLSTLAFLSTLDLSFNSIYSLQNVHYRIGNLQRLILSNNFISTTNGGIDRLVALEELALDYNCISDLASISGLAQLPELKRLHLKGNPLQKNIWRSRRRSRLRIHRTQNDSESSNQQNRSRLKTLLTFRSSNGMNKKTESKFLSSGYAVRAYRVDVLNLFRECRQYDLPSTATYRMLQEALPILDGEITTLEELIALRQRTFVPIMTGTINPISMEHSMLVPSIRNILSNQIQEQVQASEIVENNEGIVSFSHKYRKNGKRKYRRKHVQIIDTNDESGAPGTVDIVPHIDFNDSSVPGVCSFGFTVSDVILSLENSLDSNSIQRRDDTMSLEAVSVVETIDADTVAFPDLDPYDNLAIRYLEAAEKAEILLSNASTKTRPRKKTVSIALKKHDSALMIMLDPAKDRTEQITRTNEAGILLDEEECLSQDLTTEMKNRHNDTVSLDNELRDLSLSAIKVDGNDDVDPKTEEEVASHNFTRSVASMSTHSEDLDTVPPPVSQIAYLNTSTDDTISVATMSSRVALRFPDQAWHGDDQSVISNFSGMASDLGGTVATNTVNLNATKMFLWAEDNAVYEGPRTYKDLKIVDNLELYFRLFVFSKSVCKAAALLSESTQDDLVRNFQTYQEQYPRIQLWPIDRRRREISTASNRDDSNNEFIPAFKRMDESTGEDFRRVWKERVIACGKPALQRLLPSRVPRYSFHGELIWSTADTTSLKPEVAVEHRNVILCLSNRAIFVIMDNDRLTKNPVATKTKISDVKKKRFPLPISEDALFEEAKWPHAVARYPFEALKGITIGFAFQRLTLHFSPSNNVSSKRNKNTVPQIDQGDFTYILLISNKVQAVQILNEIQQLANDVREAYEGGPSSQLDSSSTMNIDNDDRHVLDALGIAVAPDTISVILHYQILHQKWRRGDRGLVRRVCVVTDTKMYLLDEDYFRDGSDVASLAGVGAIRSQQQQQQQQGSAAVASYVAFKPKTVAGETTYRLVDAASLDQISQVQAADADPNAITFVVKPLKHFQKSRHWRLVCRDGYGAERLVEDVRKAIAMS